MPKQKGKQVKRSRIDQILAYPVFKVQVGAWLLIFSLLGCIIGLFTLTIYEYSSATTEKFVAEVADKWTEQYESETGGYRVYRVRLKQEEQVFTCSVSSAQMKLWIQLQLGETYEFAVNQTFRQCLIYEANLVNAVNLSESK